MERKPKWIRAAFDADEAREMHALMDEMGLNTVCREANCPNQGECFARHTATFMILGRHCTRNCRFCNVTHAIPDPVDPDEPKRLAETAKHLGLHHVVVTSVTRDDLPDRGAGQFARVIDAVHAAGMTIETLIPDFDAPLFPDVLAHNLETVPSLYPSVRPGADYARSLDVLRHARVPAKTGIMLGLGETEAEVLALFDDARAAGVSFLTIGQYLRPSPAHLPVVEYITPERFDFYRDEAKKRGFLHVASAPLVRSSYHAEEALDAVR